MSDPREDLANHMAQAWHGPDAAPEHINDDVKSTIHLMEEYAIGKWVSVGERLPDREKTGEWRGYAKFKNGEIDIITWHHYQAAKDIIEWLDLSLPEVEGGE